MQIRMLDGVMKPALHGPSRLLKRPTATMVVAVPLSATNYSLGHASRTVILVLESLKKTRDDDRDRDRLGNRVVGERVRSFWRQVLGYDNWA